MLAKNLSHCYKNFLSVIKANNLNGFAKAVSLKTFRVQASDGDIKKFAALARQLEIKNYTVA